MQNVKKKLQKNAISENFQIFQFLTQQYSEMETSIV